MARSTAAATPSADPIAHVIVLALENRSFDHMLGALQAVKPEIDGVPPGGAPRSNQFEGRAFPQQDGAARILVEDPRHETPHVLLQLKQDAGGNPNGGFVEDYATSYPMLKDDDVRQEVMKYHARYALPALHALAENFTVCDRWFSSVPGPTWTNRLFLMSGTSLGRVDMPGGLMDLNLHWYDQPTIFDRLNETGVRNWAVYHGDTPLSLLLTHQWEPQNANRYKPMRLGPLGERAAQAKSFASALGGTARTDTPPSISAVPDELTPVVPPPRQPLNDHQTALVALSHALESMAGEDPSVVAARSQQVLTGPQSQIDAAVERVDEFLKHGAALLIKQT